MKFSEEDKKNFLKGFTKILKSIKGKGPGNIFIRYKNDEIHVVIEDSMSVYEKYLIKNFKQEAVNMLQTIYEKDCNNKQNEFSKLINSKYECIIYEVETDFNRDIFTYKIKMEE